MLGPAGASQPPRNEGHMRKGRVTLAVAASSLALTACTLRGMGGIFEMLANGFGLPNIEFVKGGRVDATLNVQASVDIGGLSGTYTVDLGPHGSFSGTATIVGQKKAKHTIEDTPELIATARSLCLEAFGQDLPVDAAKMTFRGSQTTGGVKKLFNLKISASGTVPEGERAGKRFRLKFRTEGDLEEIADQN
ncbi:MAG: hypothetical protein HMLKMBBP_02644 [Planctomycetes bacterium]|nr:hypothetical protein [Planctomycetota bacterium]